MIPAAIAVRSPAVRSVELQTATSANRSVALIARDGGPFDPAAQEFLRLLRS